MGPFKCGSEYICATGLRVGPKVNAPGINGNKPNPYNLFTEGPSPEGAEKQNSLRSSFSSISAGDRKPNYRFAELDEVDKKINIRSVRNTTLAVSICGAVRR